MNIIGHPYLSLSIASLIIIARLGMASILTCREWKNPATRRGLYAIMIGTIIIAVADNWWTTAVVNRALASVAEEFNTTAEKTIPTRNIDENGNGTYDYAGALDTIIKKRDKITAEMGATGIALKWWAGNSGQSFGGFYVNNIRLTLILVLWVAENLAVNIILIFRRRRVRGGWITQAHM